MSLKSLKRPEHAADCPGCDGWIAGATILCSRCTGRVQQFKPELYPYWLSLRAVMNHSTADACAEAFTRGYIIGTAKVLHTQKGAPARCLLN